MKNLLALGVLLTMFGAGCNQQWTLSLYKDGATVQRLQYETKGECIAAGSSIASDENMDRFDCGYSCKGDMDDFEDAIICNEICDASGCRK